MFTRTYKEKYTINRVMFSDFFQKLRKYVEGTEVDLKQLVDSFFAVLYQKVYILFNSHYQFNSYYQNCILQSVDSVHPFGDSPRKIAVSVSRSFLASRVLLESLQVGHQVIQKLLELKPNQECKNAFTKLTQCSVCHNLHGVKPCYNFCLNVLKGCFAYPAVVNMHWNEYIAALQKLTNKLGGPFSMEAIIEPLGVKISEAIMVFQEHKQNISSSVSPLKFTTFRPSSIILGSLSIVPPILDFFGRRGGGGRICSCSQLQGAVVPIDSVELVRLSNFLDLFLEGGGGGGERICSCSQLQGAVVLIDSVELRLSNC